MIYFGNLHSFKDYYLKKLATEISDNHFFEYHYEPISSVESIIAFLGQISASKKGIVLAYVKDKADVTALLKLLKGATISKKKKYVKVVVVNDYFGLKNFALLKNKGVDIIFENKPSKGAVNYAIMKLVNQFNQAEEKGYFQDFAASVESQNMFTEHKEVPIKSINTESGHMEVSLHTENLKPLRCYLEDIDDTNLVLRLPVNDSQGFSKTIEKEVECKISLEYESDQFRSAFPIYIKKMEYSGDHFYLHARNIEPSEDSKKLYEIYGKRQENISKFVYHARV